MSVAIVVQVPTPAGERWKTTEATPEPGSAESDETVTVPRRTLPLPGAVREPVGGRGVDPDEVRADGSSLPTTS